MRRAAKCGEGVERGRRVRIHLLDGIAPDDDREVFRPSPGVQRAMRGFLPTVRDKSEGNRGTREALDEVFGPGQGLGVGEVDVASAVGVAIGRFDLRCLSGRNADARDHLLELGETEGGDNPLGRRCEAARRQHLPQRRRATRH